MAPSTYYAAKKRETNPSARAVRDAMQVLMTTLWVANRKVYGAHKLWKAARRAGHDIGRDATARLMRLMASRACPAGGARCSPPALTPTPCGHRTWSTATSSPSSRTSCG